MLDEAFIVGTDSHRLMRMSPGCEDQKAYDKYCLEHGMSVF